MKSKVIIEGWFDFENIYDLAVDTFDNCAFLEVGTYKGKSVAYLMSKIRDRKKNITVCVVDIFKPEYEKEFLNNMKELGFSPHIFKGKSSEVSHQFKDGQFAMIYIDAAHDYESVKSDLNNYYPKLKDGGIFAGHDYFEPCGVKQAVDEFAINNNLKLEIRGSSWLCSSY